MYALPKAMGQYDKVIFDGKVVYPDHEDYIPNTALDDTFIENLGKLIQRMASSDPARRVPSGMECGFCNITTDDCSDRIIEEEFSDLSGETEDF